MKIALLSNVTIEVLAGMLKKEHELWLAPGFGGWMEIALGVPEDLKQFSPEAVFLLLDSSHAKYNQSDVDKAVASLESALPRATVIVPDIADCVAELEETATSFYDERMWKLGSMPWSMKGLRALKSEINRLIQAMNGDRKKVLALDFDNTLWRGVIGEDGLDGIEPFVEFQQELKQLRERGVLLVGLTKNNADDVEPVWNDPRMVLKRDDFVDLRINWDDKAKNLEDSAKALNLGTDSFVFVDDNPAERMQMTAMHPEVVVPDWPISGRRLVRLYFPRLRVTAEDLSKTEQYHAERKRKELEENLSVEDYLTSLEIHTDIHPVHEDEIARVAQLSQKTNQFNVCTNRYTVEEVARFAADQNHLIVTLHAGDKFGDQGLVAFVHVACVNGEWEIADWVMSCRVMNRRIEFEVQQWVESELKRRGITKLYAWWRWTAKNAPVRDLFEKFNFVLLSETEMEKKYERVLA